MSKQPKMTTHALERTSPLGGAFLGRCRLCGQDDLTMGDALEPCSNPRGITQSDALLEAIEGHDEQATPDKH